MKIGKKFWINYDNKFKKKKKSSNNKCLNNIINCQITALGIRLVPAYSSSNCKKCFSTYLSMELRTVIASLYLCVATIAKMCSLSVSSILIWLTSSISLPPVYETNGLNQVHIDSSADVSQFLVRVLKLYEQLICNYDEDFVDCAYF